MGLYTVMQIYPRERFVPSESFLRELLDYLRVTKIQIASGDKRESFLARIRKSLFPRPIEIVSGGEVFWETNIDVEKGISLWLNCKAYLVHFSLPNEGWSSETNDEIEEKISPALANGFLPWDCGITIGPWQAHDYDTGAVIAQGSFSIGKSANGNPLGLKEYEKEFSDLTKVRELIQYLETRSEMKWAVTCELT